MSTTVNCLYRYFLCRNTKITTKSLTKVDSNEVLGCNAENKAVGKKKMVLNW